MEMMEYYPVSMEICATTTSHCWSRKMMPSTSVSVNFYGDRGWMVSTKCYWKFQAQNSDRRVMIRKATARAVKVGHELKRLQRRQVWKTLEKCRERRMEMANRFHRRQERREAKLRRDRRTMLHTPNSCKLWNCERRRRRPRRVIHDVDQNGEGLAMQGDVPQRRGMRRCNSRRSVLSDLSARSRTPIRTLRSSPLLNDRGFQTEYNV